MNANTFYNAMLYLTNTARFFDYKTNIKVTWGSAE